MFFRRRRRRAEATARPAISAPGTDPRPWLEHGLSDGATVPCESCGRPRSVRIVEQTQVAIAVADDVSRNILVCTGCGRLLCQDCALPGDAMSPKCDNCGDNAVFPMA